MLEHVSNYGRLFLISAHVLLVSCHVVPQKVLQFGQSSVWPRCAKTLLNVGAISNVAEILGPVLAAMYPKPQNLDGRKRQSERLAERKPT